MKTITARGLVLREYEAGESDKRLLLLCKELGRITVYARGARKPKSKILALAQLFTYADFVLAAGRGFYSVTQGDIIESFYNLRADYDRLMAAHLIAEVCEKTVLENVSCDELLLLTLKSLSLLSKGKYPPMQISGVFLMRFFDFHGLRPQTDACAACNYAAPENMNYFSPEGILCTKCAKYKTAHPASKPALAAVSHILKSSLSESFGFKATDDILQEVMQIAIFLWDCHFGRELTCKWQSPNT